MASRAQHYASRNVRWKSARVEGLATMVLSVVGGKVGRLQNSAAALLRALDLVC
jgi:uncharacterized membrane protein YfcA